MVFGVSLLALVLITLTSSSAAGPRPIPPGYSSETIHVKFREGTDVDHPQIVLGPGLSNAVARVTRLFSLPKDKLDEIRARGRNRSGRTLSDLNLWFHITLQPGTDASAFLEDLKRLQSVEIAEPAPLPAPPPGITPDFTANQGYLDAAPGGIDAFYSFTIPGGNGSGIKIYDVEYSWNQAHEDLSKAHGLPLLLNAGDSAVDPFSDNNHGTAVLGELIADNDAKGITGISCGADTGLAPANTANLGYNPANAILLAVADGSAGDVILLEQQFPVCGSGNFGPIEWLFSVFAAIQVAVANGFVVVEAAGNGGVDLDQAACGGSFDRTVRDSGAIIVGAGAPPSSGFDRARLGFSSFGGRVDLQGWGTNVMTTGYGFLYTNPDDPTNPDFWYTDDFNGTSSASPNVAGAVANLQGIALNQFGVPMASTQIRTLLVQTGSPQSGNTAEHIGPRPDLRQAIAQLEGIAVEVALDIKLGGFPNPINPRSKGVIPVAILTTETFNATTVNPTTVRFGATGSEAAPVHSTLEDVDGDGNIDMILHFKTQDTGIQCGKTFASLTGQTFDGRAVEGFDSIVTVGCR
jgi:serine protease